MRFKIQGNMKITRAQLRSIIKEAVSVDRLKALEGRPHKIDLDSILSADKRKEMFQDAYAEGKKAEGRWYETAFGASESPDSDPDDPFWSVAPIPIAIFVALWPESTEINIEKVLLILIPIMFWAFRLTVNWIRIQLQRPKLRL